jgi:hypothetical protein
MKDKEGLPPSSYRLVLAGRNLDDTSLVSETSIRRNACLHIMLNLAGGGTGNLGMRLLGEKSERIYTPLPQFIESNSSLFSIQKFD